MGLWLPGLEDVTPPGLAYFQKTGPVSPTMRGPFLLMNADAPPKDSSWRERAFH
jgi:hypothetical protein